MPYYFDVTSPNWEKYACDEEDSEIGDPPRSWFEFIPPELAKTSIVAFPKELGPEPEKPRPFALHPKTVARPGFLARLFGKRSAEPWPAPQGVDSHDIPGSEHAIWTVSRDAGRARDLGVRRILGGYDGGNDESFTHFRSVELSNGETLTSGELTIALRGVDYEMIVESAVGVLMGNYGAGEFALRGAVVIDVVDCTITDEKNPDIVFQKWPNRGR